MKVAGITGGIGSGKSTVARIMGELGAYVLDADQIAREIVEPDQPAWRDIKGFFGDAALNPDRTINRKKLAEIVFSNPAARKKLEFFTHPRIGQTILKGLEKARGENRKLAVVDAALLVESSPPGWLKPLILVTADEGVRVRRACGRDDSCADEIRARIRNQASDPERKLKADIIIDNNGSESELRAKVLEIFRQLASD